MGQRSDSHVIKRLAVAACVAALAASGCRETGEQTGEVLVAGAADLVFAMQELIPAFEEASGTRVKFSPGSSGKLAAQIREGAPFDVFLSANVGFADDVVSAGVCDRASKTLYARGRIVLWAGPDGQPPPPADLTGLTDPRYKKIAIANPDHAPYGIAARQALKKLGVWNEIESRLVYGSNIKDTMQFAETGNAEIAIIALSLATRSPGAFVKIPGDRHEPIDQAMVVCTNGRSEKSGRKFAAFIRSPQGQGILNSYGFDQPADR